MDFLRNILDLLHRGFIPLIQYLPFYRELRLDLHEILYGTGKFLPVLQRPGRIIIHPSSGESLAAGPP